MDNRSGKTAVSAAGNTDKGTVTSVRRALRLLECFSHENSQPSLAELARVSGLNKTTTYRLLATLQRAGWIERVGNAEYRLTLRAFEVGSIAATAIDLHADAGPVLSELVSTYGETAFLTVVDGDRAVCLERVEGRQLIRILALDVGKSLPLTVGGGPVAMLAFNEEELLPRVLARGFARFTGRSVQSEQELRKRLAETRERGYALSEEDVTHGICAIGAPILGSSGRALGALSLAGVSARFAPPRREELARGLIEACKTLSDRLKYLRA